MACKNPKKVKNGQLDHVQEGSSHMLLSATEGDTEMGGSEYLVNRAFGENCCAGLTALLILLLTQRPINLKCGRV